MSDVNLSNYNLYVLNCCHFVPKKSTAIAITSEI